MSNEKNQDKKRQNKWKNITGSMVIIMIMAVLGYLMGYYSGSKNTSNISFGGKLISLGFQLIGIFIIIFLQIIIHEVGHLVFGLLSGYRYSSFRIGSFMWLKKDGKIHFKRLSLAGTEGQCLLCPPEMVNGKMPFFLYNLGGSLMNVISSLIFIGVYMICKDIAYLSVFLIMASIVGFAIALMNAIPMKLGVVNNDGYNALSVSKSNAAVHAWWVQLKVSEQISKGVRLKDMPKEWFVVPSDKEMKNSITATIGVFATNRMMDMQDFDEAKELMDKLLVMDSAIVGLHRQLIVCDKIYCELIDGNRNSQLDNMLDKPQKQFMKQMKNFPSVMRTEYAYALIAEKNSQKAEQMNAQFEKIAITYPYQGDIVSERELIEVATQKFDEISSADVIKQP